jgi:transcriptional regulator GlxA family with amidase domain
MPATARFATTPTRRAPRPAHLPRRSYPGFLVDLHDVLEAAGIATVSPLSSLPTTSAHGTDAEGSAEWVVGTVETFVSDHLDANLTLDHLADAAGVSPSSLLRRFKEHAGVTPWQYVIEARVERACTLLETTDRTLAEIALDTGFYDQPHFTRTFKEHVGCTPGEYRNRVRA